MEVNTVVAGEPLILKVDLFTVVNERTSNHRCASARQYHVYKFFFARVVEVISGDIGNIKLPFEVHTVDEKERLDYLKKTLKDMGLSGRLRVTEKKGLKPLPFVVG